MANHNLLQRQVQAAIRLYCALVPQGVDGYERVNEIIDGARALMQATNTGSIVAAMEKANKQLEDCRETFKVFSFWDNPDDEYDKIPDKGHPVYFLDGEFMTIPKHKAIPDGAVLIAQGKYDE